MREGMKEIIRSRARRIFALSVLGISVVAFAGGTAMAKDKKYGVFVGISAYPGDTLPGTTSDAKKFRNLMISKFGFSQADTELILDKNATRANMITSLKKYGGLAAEGDLLVFFYAGHGSLFPDSMSPVIDETQKTLMDIVLLDGRRLYAPLDYYDSTLVAWDSRDAKGNVDQGDILDDELYELFSAVTKKGATVVFVSDSCNSGTIAKNEAADANARIRMMAPQKAQGALKKPENQVRIETREFGGNYIALSAARDQEPSWGGLAGGLFTNVLIKVINSSTGPLTYAQLMSLVEPMVSKTALAAVKVDQRPQLDGRFGNPANPIFVPITVTR